MDFLLSWQLSEQLHTYVQVDYGEEDRNAALPDRTQAAKWSAFGLWVMYDFSKKWGLAFRGDFLDDRNGARTSGAPGPAPYPTNVGQKLYSGTLTLNLHPTEKLQIRPEIRYDYSTLANAYPGRQITGLERYYSGRTMERTHDQRTIALGVAYLF